MPKPTSVPGWNAPDTAVVEPLAGEKNAGFAPGYKPPAEYFNWFWRLVSTWITWLRDFESTTHTWTSPTNIFNGNGTDAPLRANSTGLNSAVLATSQDGAPAVSGVANALDQPGIEGTNAVDGPGVWGKGRLTKPGVKGTSAGGTGSGVEGTGGTGASGVKGIGGDNGGGPAGPGVHGVAGTGVGGSPAGVKGDGPTGVLGTATGGGEGVKGVAGPSGSGGDGVLGQGTGPGSGGVRGVGGIGDATTAGGIGVYGVGGGSGGAGGGGPGGKFERADGNSSKPAIEVVNGSIAHAASPASNVSLVNQFTGLMYPKAWALVRWAGVGNATILAGQNITSVVIENAPIDGRVSVNLAANMASVNYGVFIQGQLSAQVGYEVENSKATNGFKFREVGLYGGNEGLYSLGANMVSPHGVLIMVFGAQ